MSQFPRFLYTKCLKSDLSHGHATLGDTGLSKKWFFCEVNDSRLKHSLQKFEVIIKIDCLQLPSGSEFMLNESGVWSSCCVVPMGAVCAN